MKKNLVMILILVLSLLAFLKGNSVNTHKDLKSAQYNTYKRVPKEEVDKEEIFNYDRKIYENEYCSAIRHNDNTYTVYLYDSKKNIVFKQILLKEPFFEEFDNGIVMIGVSLGSPLNYKYFYDGKNNKISNTYENLIAIIESKVIYMQGEYLIISDMFDESVYYKEIHREWAKTAEPSTAVISVQLLDTNQVELIYYVGYDFVEVKEIIDL